MTFTILVIWYALGLASVGMLAIADKKVVVGGLAACLFIAPVAFFAFTVLSLCRLSSAPDITLWEKSNDQ